MSVLVVVGEYRHKLYYQVYKPKLVKKEEMKEVEVASWPRPLKRSGVFYPTLD